MKITSIVSDAYDENTWIVEVDDQVFVIDPGCDDADLKSTILNLQSTIVLLTHGHYDHILAIDMFDKENIYAHEDEKELLGNPAMNLSGFTGKYISIDGIKYFSGKQALLSNVMMFETPGHTAGGVIYKLGNNIFTGDTLFYDTVGRTDMPTGDSKVLKESLKIFDTFDKEVMCYPGHGESFKLGDAYKANYFLK